VFGSLVASRSLRAVRRAARPVRRRHRGAGQRTGAATATITDSVLSQLPAPYPGAPPADRRGRGRPGFRPDSTHAHQPVSTRWGTGFRCAGQALAERTAAAPATRLPPALARAPAAGAGRSVPQRAGRTGFRCAAARPGPV